MTRNIISFHDLFKDGYKFSFDNENGDILVYSNGCFLFKASPCKGIYQTVECISHNGNVILNVGSSKELDKSKLWHSRLGHVNKKHIAQLQKDGVLESFDFKSDDVCESFLLGKMTKSPFTGSCEREVVTHVEPDDISLPIHRTSSRVSKPPQLYYGFDIEEDKISNSTLSELDEPANYKEAMASLEAAK
ncbi:retrotransposon protein, putative, ty1-copia subclass [Tanacetum coccineum]